MKNKIADLLSKLKFSKEKFLYLCIVALLLIVVFLIGKGSSIFLASTKTITPVPTKMPTPTATPTLTPTPTSQPTTNNSLKSHQTNLLSSPTPSLQPTQQPVINNYYIPPTTTPINNYQAPTQTPVVVDCSPINNAVNNLKAGEQSAINQQTQTTTNELVSRGVDINSAAAQQDIQQSIAPIQATYNSQIAQVCLRANPCPCP